MIIYIDETGDLGFNFKLSRTSKFFVMSALIFNNTQHYKRAITHVEKAKKRGKIVELKGKSLQSEKKEKLHFFLKKLDWELHSIVIDKRKIFKPRSINNFYDDIAVKLITHCCQNSCKSSATIKIVLDKCKNNQQEIILINTKIEKALRRHNYTNDINIHHNNSKNEIGLQMIDLYSYGIYKKFEDGDTSWFSIFKEKIKKIAKS